MQPRQTISITYRTAFKVVVADLALAEAQDLAKTELADLILRDIGIRKEDVRKMGGARRDSHALWGINSER